MKFCKHWGVYTCWSMCNSPCKYKNKNMYEKKQNNWMNTPITMAVILLCNLKKTWQLFWNIKFFPKLFTKINVWINLKREIGRAAAQPWFNLHQWGLIWTEAASHVKKCRSSWSNSRNLVFRVKSRIKDSPLVCHIGCLRLTAQAAGKKNTCTHSKTTHTHTN